jgi:hypothetical protein
MKNKRLSLDSNIAVKVSIKDYVDSLIGTKRKAGVAVMND